MVRSTSDSVRFSTRQSGSVRWLTGVVLARARQPVRRTASPARTNNLLIETSTLMVYAGQARRLLARRVVPGMGMHLGVIKLEHRPVAQSCWTLGPNRLLTGASDWTVRRGFGT